MKREEIRTLLAAGAVDDARKALTASLESSPERHDDHVAWAELAEAAGLTGIARREYHLALRDDEHDVKALRGLAVLLADTGAIREETHVRRKLARLLPEEESVPAEPELHSAPKLEPLPGCGVGDLVRFLHLFGGRENAYARQWWNDAHHRGGYAPVREPLTADVLRRHMSGEETLGVYIVRVDGTATCLVLDLDVRKGDVAKARRSRTYTRELRAALRDEGRRLREELAAWGLRGLLFDSGYKGRHVWVPLRAPLTAPAVHALGRGLAAALAPDQPALSLEVFPKQGKVSEGGLGNLVKLPLGVHRRSGRRAHLLDADGRPAQDPWPTLRAFQPNERWAVLEALQRLPRRTAVRGEPTEKPFVEEELRTDTQLSQVLKSCPVLGELVAKALRERHLRHDEQVVLRHSLGHLTRGVAAVNFILGSCPTVRPHVLLKSRLAGNPISCPRIRQRVPDVTRTVACHCAFAHAPEHYPSPVLHAPGED